MTVLAPTARVRKPNPVTQSYTALAQAVRDKGLLSRTRWFYGVLLIGLGLALGGVVTGFILLDDSWFQLLIAAALGVILTQFAFLGARGLAPPGARARARPTTGSAGSWPSSCVGISYSWWMNKHTRHHANPNKVGKDPDIEIDTFSLRGGERGDQARVQGLVHPAPGLLFFPLLLLEGINLHLKSVQQPVGEPPTWRVVGSSSTVLGAAASRSI